MLRLLATVALALSTGGPAGVLAAPAGERTLIVQDGNAAALDEAALAALGAQLTGRGHKVVQTTLKEASSIFRFDEPAYDNVLIVPGKTKGLGRHLASVELLRYVGQGGNLLVLTTAQSAPASLRETAAQLGIQIGTRGTEIVDHFDSAGQAKTSQAGSAIDAHLASWLATGSAAKHLYGSAAGYLTGENKYAMSLAGVSDTAYAYNAILAEDDGAVEPFALGSDVLAAAGTQTRNNGRFGWVGSVDLLTDESIQKWVFQEDEHTLRLKDVSHSLQASDESHQIYKVEDELRYCASVEAWNGQTWVPKQGLADLQLEFKMLDPYYRLTLLEQETQPGTYCVDFKAPDQYGMFTFSLKYLRPGFSFLRDSKVVTMRHTANDEWPRSWKITNSWVYLASACAVIGAWVLFVGVFLGLPEIPKHIAAADEKVGEKARLVVKNDKKDDKKDDKKSKKKH